MSNAALLNLVRLNPLNETAASDYTAGEPASRFDEIPLVDPTGVPCAVPRPPAYQNMDYRYRFLGGDQGHQLRLLSRNLAVQVDYIDAEKDRRLERWLNERARVLVCPNLGRNTLLSWRPLAQVGTAYAGGGTAYDLTGRNALAVTQPAGVLLWDPVHRVLSNEAASDSLTLLPTPGGAGAGFLRSVRNLMQPPSPESANTGPGAGNSGWNKWGTDGPGQLTFSYNATGFGHQACPGSLRVTYSATVSASRAVGVQTLWDSSSGQYGGIALSGAGTATACVWLRGKFPDGAYINFGPGAAAKSIDLAGANLTGWTPFCISVNSSAWTSTGGSPDLTFIGINLTSTSGEGGWFEIGPTMMVQASGISYPYGPYWSDSTAYSGGSKIATVSNFEIPDAGTLAVSFFVPSDFYTGTSGPMSGHNFGLMGSATFGWTLVRSYSDNLYRFQLQDSSSGFPLSWTSAALPVTALRPGRINTAAVTFQQGAVKVYFNGALIDTLVPAAAKIMPGTSTPLWIGADRNSHACFPLKLLTARVDEGAMTGDELANLHLALTDPIALSFAAAARGRVYQVTGIPQTLRDGAGGSEILGQIDLEQVGYLPEYADPLANLEANVP